MMTSQNMEVAIASPASGESLVVEGVSLKLGRRLRDWQRKSLKAAHEELGWTCEELGSMLWFTKPHADPKQQMYRVVDTRNSRVLIFRYNVEQAQELRKRESRHEPLY